MRIYLTLALLFWATWCFPQTVTITGTVSKNSCAYANGSGRAVLVPQNQQWLVNGTNPVPTPVVISGLDSFGAFSVSLTNTALISPASASPQWQFSFCSQAVNGQQPACFTMTPMALTTSQDISTQIQAQAAPIQNCTAGTTITLKTNGVNNGSQSILNLQQGSNVAITDNGTGTDTFNVTGVVTSVATGTGLTGGPITSMGTISLANTAVTPGAYTLASITVDQQGRLTVAGSGTPYTLPTQYTKLRCETGLGDGLSAMAAGTYLQFFCVNTSGVTWTITGIRCWTDNAGTSTLNAANNAATGLLTGAVTCNNTKASGGAAGTQSGTTTLASGDAISFTFVADGTSKQATFVVSMTQ